MSEMTLYMAQRLSALVLAPLVMAHLGLMIYAVRGGLTAGAILARTQGSLAWGLFYGVFVLAVSVHAAIGLRVIAREVLGLEGLSLNGFAGAAFFGLLASGLYAVLAVTVAP